MQQDDEPLGGVTTPSGAPEIKGAGPGGTASAIDERLFEDILDLEGALRLTTQATAGLGAPRAGEIEALGRQLPEPAGSRLQQFANDIRSATQAGNIMGVREAQLGVIDSLTALRTAVWSTSSED